MASTHKTAMPALPAEELDTLEALFAKADLNADGVVDFPEFKGVMELLAGKTGKRYNALPRACLTHAPTPPSPLLAVESSQVQRVAAARYVPPRRPRR